MPPAASRFDVWGWPVPQAAHSNAGRDAVCPHAPLGFVLEHTGSSKFSLRNRQLARNQESRSRRLSGERGPAAAGSDHMKGPGPSLRPPGGRRGQPQRGCHSSACSTSLNGHCLPGWHSHGHTPVATSGHVSLLPIPGLDAVRTPLHPTQTGPHLLPMVPGVVPPQPSPHFRLTVPSSP